MCQAFRVDQAAGFQGSRAATSRARSADVAAPRADPPRRCLRGRLRRPGDQPSQPPSREQRPQLRGQPPRVAAQPAHQRAVRAAVLDLAQQQEERAHRVDREDRRSPARRRRGPGGPVLHHDLARCVERRGQCGVIGRDRIDSQHELVPVACDERDTRQCGEAIDQRSRVGDAGDAPPERVARGGRGVAAVEQQDAAQREGSRLPVGRAQRGAAATLGQPCRHLVSRPLPHAQRLRERVHQPGGQFERREVVRQQQKAALEQRQRQRRLTRARGAGQQPGAAGVRHGAGVQDGEPRDAVEQGLEDAREELLGRGAAPGGLGAPRVERRTVPPVPGRGRPRHDERPQVVTQQGGQLRAVRPDEHPRVEQFDRDPERGGRRLVIGDDSSAPARRRAPPAPAPTRRRPAPAPRRRPQRRRRRAG